MLQKVTERFSKTWLLIDALDELEPDNKDDLMDAVEILKGSIRFLITSRPQSIDSNILFQNTRRCTLSAHAEDLAAFIRNRMSKTATASRRVRESPGWGAFVNDTVEKLVEVADGMFILVSVQLEMLLRPRTLAEMRKLLENVSVKLDDFYANTLERIKARESELALKVLSWLVRQMRPLSVKEIQEALAVEYSTTSINSDAFSHKDDILEMCHGFVVINEEEILSLAHATVHEFLASKLDDVDRFDLTMAKTCLRYLNFETFNEQTMNFYHLSWVSPGEYDVEYDRRVERNPFFLYAARYWSNHFNKASKSEELDDLAMTLITGPNVPAMLQAYNSNAVVHFPRFTPLHVAAFLGIPSLVELLISGATQWIQESSQQGSSAYSLEKIVDSDSAFGNTPLLFAVKRRHRDIAKALLDTNAVNPSIMDNTIIRWTLEWKQPDLLRHMVRMPKFNEPLARRQFGRRIEKYLSAESGGDDDDSNDDAKDEHNDDEDSLQQRTRARRRGLNSFGLFDD